MAEELKITAYLKPTCGWSGGIRAVLAKYGLEYEDKDIINYPENYQEMVQKTGQPYQPCVEIGETMLADVSGDELESWLVQNSFKVAGPEPEVPTDSSCTDEEHEEMARVAQSQPVEISFKPQQ
ncbi:MAG TPA: glutaredoxin [Candidatus Latescibacteria bacterium]|jgi:monothiol glutaredoxin|nr:glutaredoxin [Candidatus Latescibacterota bacterium]